MKFPLLICFLLLSRAVSAISDTALVKTPEDIRVLVAELRSREFQDLDSAQISLQPFHQSGYFFQSNFSADDFFHRHRRTYVLCYNPDLFRIKLTAFAVRGVLAHELSHMVDYENRNGCGLLKTLIRLGFHRSRVRYEKQTDIRAIARGFDKQLIAFREGIYPVLSPKQLAIKKDTYYTPEKITEIASRLKVCEALYGDKTRLLNQFLRNPPQ